MDRMGVYTLGELTTVPVLDRLDLLAPPTAAALQDSAWASRVGVVPIDPTVSDTDATRSTYGLEPETLANCVVVAGRRDGQERIAACMVLATTRADINGTVRRLLDVRKASFLSMDRAVETTGMEYGGITPVGLPQSWPILVDQAVADSPAVIIGSGVRRSKLILPGALLGQLPGAQIVPGLGR
jgi:prolyl-tRNA editing enzyme YbaK/EbsC (Cys-tRNA(Pro) deacylase)